jgi:hypothetical protein
MPPRSSLAPIARIATAGSLALAAAFAAAGSVSAYPAPAGTAALRSSCGSVAPGGDCSLSFTLLDSASHPISGAPVSFTISGLSAGSIGGTATTNSSGVASLSFRDGVVGSSADCGKTGTVTGTSHGSTAQTQITITCGAGNGLPSGSFINVLATLVTDATGGVLVGTFGGSSYTLTVPTGSLPVGTHIQVLSADLSKLTPLVTAGDALVSGFDIEWPGGAISSTPVSFDIHNTAFHAGQAVDQVLSGSLSLYPNATVSEGVAHITFSADPAFAVVAPSTAVPSGLGNEGAAPAVISPSHDTGAAAAVAGAALFLALVTVPVVRRRRGLA